MLSVKMEKRKMPTSLARLEQESVPPAGGENNPDLSLLQLTEPIKKLDQN